MAAEHPRTVLGAFAIACALAVPGLLRLRLRTDGSALVPEDAPAVRAERALRARFDHRDSIAVVVERDGAGGVFTAATLRTVQRASDALSALPGLGPEGVISLATERGDVVRPGTLEFLSWLEPLPADDEAAARLERTLRPIPSYRGTLLADDEPPTATAILVRMPAGDRLAFVHAVEEQASAAQREADPGTRVRVVGAPVAEALLGEHVLNDLARFLPLTLLALAAVFRLGLGSTTAAALGLAEVGSALVVVFGCMGWLGFPVYLTTAVLPVILAATGVTDELHLLTAFARRGPGSEPCERAVELLRDLGPALTTTSTTTALGFASFALSPLPPVRTFGLFMALGIAYCLAWSLLVMPAALTWWSTGIRPRRVRARRRSAARIGRALTRLGTAVLEHSFRVRVAFVALLAGLALLAGRVRMDDSWLSGFAAGSELRRATEEVEARFGGTHTLEIVVEGEALRAEGRLESADIAPGRVRIPADAIADPALVGGHELTVTPEVVGRTRPSLRAHVLSAEHVGSTLELHLDPRDPDVAARWPSAAPAGSWRLDGRDRCLQPQILERLRTFERALAARGDLGIGRVLGPWELLATTHYLAQGRIEDERRVPSEPAAINELLDHYRRVRGRAAGARLIEGDGRAVHLTVFARHATFARSARLAEWVRTFGREHLEPYGLRLELAGDVIVSQSVVAGIVSSQLGSLGLGLLGVFVVLLLVQRGLSLAWACAAPTSFSILANMALLGALDIPVGVATSMFASITLGIGVDYAVHFTAQARRLAARGAGPRAWVAGTLRRIGPAIVLDFLAVGGAFGLLGLSSVPANRHLAWLVLAGLATALVVTLTLLPTLLSLPPPSTPRPASR